MFALVRLQVLTSLLLMLIAGIFFGVQAAYSLGLGAACYVIPTALAVIFLKFLKPYPAMVGMGFIVSEGLKIVLALILLVAVVILYKSLQFLPFFVGLLAVSHLVFLFFLKVHRYGKCK
ncbi:ATP synthase subunit I [Neisseriaceae bacterium B1]